MRIEDLLPKKEKNARLYCQLMKKLELLPGYKEIFEQHGNHVVRYSRHAGLTPGVTSPL